MPHIFGKLLLPFWTTSLAWAVVTLFTVAADGNAQETLQPYASPILHTFLDSANVYPESVTVDQSSGTFFVGSVKEGTNMDILHLNGLGKLKFRSCYSRKHIDESTFQIPYCHQARPGHRSLAARAFR